MDGFVKLLQEQRPHFIGFQESDLDHPFLENKDFIEYVGEGLSMYNYVGVPTRECSVGTAVAATRNLMNVTGYVLPFTDQGRVLRRGFVLTRTLIGGVWTHLWNIQIESSAQTLAQPQINLMLDFFATIPATEPVIIVGDFGFDPSNPLIQQILQAGLQSAVAAAQGADLPTKSTPDGDITADYIFFRGVQVKDANTIDLGSKCF